MPIDHLAFEQGALEHFPSPMCRTRVGRQAERHHEIPGCVNSRFWSNGRDITGRPCASLSKRKRAPRVTARWGRGRAYISIRDTFNSGIRSSYQPSEGRGMSEINEPMIDWALTRFPSCHRLRLRCSSGSNTPQAHGVDWQVCINNCHHLRFSSIAHLGANSLFSCDRLQPFKQIWHDLGIQVFTRRSTTRTNLGGRNTKIISSRCTRTSTIDITHCVVLLRWLRGVGRRSWLCSRRNSECHGGRMLKAATRSAKNQGIHESGRGSQDRRTKKNTL